MESGNFVKEAVAFLTKLSKNNNKVWFTENKKTFQDDIIEPAKLFVELMGMQLRTIVPDLSFAPRVNKSIFRINRDTRFSKNKEPYKNNLGIYFWEGTRPKLECSGFYLHIEPKKVFLGVGMYMFAKDQLKKYRDTVADKFAGGELSDLISELEVSGYSTEGRHYKRIPRGYDPGSPNSELLLHNGLYSFYNCENPKELYSVDLIDFCFDKFGDMLPIHQWLAKTLI